MKMLNQDEEVDENAEGITEDQQRINTFSKLNTRYKAIEEQMNQIKQEKEALDDLEQELELADEGEPVMYRLAESFLHLSQPLALRRLERDRTSLISDLKKLEERAGQCENEMKELKVTLYAKFGRAINLDE